MTLLALLLACKTEAPAAAKNTAAVPVRVEVLAPAPLERAVEATGTVEAIDSAEIRPEVQGLVEAVLFDDGATVRKGQPLVRLRAADARATLLDAEARATLAGASLERAQALFDRGDVAKAELDRAAADAQLARAAVARAEEAVRRTTIAAPFDGVVGRREVSVGALVGPANPVTRIEGLRNLVVDVALAEDVLAAVAPGQPAIVGALDRTFPGTVAFVAPRVREATRTVDVRIAVAEPGPLRPGMTATARIVTASVPDALLVPTQALVRSATGPAVWVVGEDGKAAQRPVKTGERTETRAEIVEGLAPGDRVVTEGLARMRPGVAVEIKADAPAEATP
ncbi:MAG: efflux RND transporter periplasmic adaptor subunit [Myxococcota bacterium]